MWRNIVTRFGSRKSALGVAATIAAGSTVALVAGDVRQRFTAKPLMAGEEKKVSFERLKC